MKSLRPYITNGLQATARPLVVPTTSVFRASSLVDCGKQCYKVVFSSQIASAHTLLANSTAARQASSTPSHQAPTRAPPSLYHYPTKKPQNGLKSQASYSTKASPANEFIIHNVFEEQTGTWQYIIADPSTLQAVIIDPVLDYDRTTQIVTTTSADTLLSLIRSKNYTITMILETHAHADHVTAASYLQHQLTKEQGLRPAIGIGKRIAGVQELFAQRYGVPAEEYEGVFDKLFDEEEEFMIGNVTATAMHLPGHTPDHLGYKVGDNVFCGDSLFHTDIGTARCDFPGGSASALFSTGQKLLSLPPSTKIWPGHDYPPPERSSPQPWMTVSQHKALNLHLKDGMTEQEFIALREKRDRILAAPKLLHQSLQINIRAGRLPRETGKGSRMLHLPLKLECEPW